MSQRWSDAWEARRLRRLAEAAERRERASLVRAGLALIAASSKAEIAQEALLGEAAELGRRLAELEAELHGSLDQDRRDYAPASQWARPLVVLRGLCARGVLYDQLRRARRTRDERCRELGERALSAEGRALAARVPAALLEAIHAARSEADKLRGQRTVLLAPYAGEALPPWAASARRELQRLGLYLLKETRVKFLPRLPAVAGLIVGWLVTRYFVSPSGALESLQFRALRLMGADSRSEVSAETLARLRFWLPIVAAALCGWLSAFVAERVRRKYMPPAAAPASTSARA